MGLDNYATQLTTSQAFVHYSLFVAMFALGAGFVFFLVEKEKILPEYRGTMVTSAIICGVAAVAYYFLTSRYRPDQPFPTDIRYIDWTVTTPLLVLKYPEMLRVRGIGFATKLIIADLFMIVTGFIGELSGHTVNGHWVLNAGGSTTAHYIWGFISTLGYAVIVFLLMTEGKNRADTQPEPIRNGIRKMNNYILTLWGVYPIVYIAEALSVSHPSINLDWFDVAASAADIVNKVGFAITAYLAVKALSGDNEKSAERLPESAAWSQDDPSVTMTDGTVRR